MNLKLQVDTPELTPDQRKIIQDVILAALQAVDPYDSVSAKLGIMEGELIIGEQVYSLSPDHHIFVCGFGKASLPMAKAAVDKLGDLVQDGAVICKHLPKNPILRKIKLLPGDHPVPGKNSILSTRSILDISKQLTKEVLIIFLISGGGSALFTLPVEGISLEDLQVVNNLLLKCGASIHEMNCLRKHIDRVKGGGLWRHIQPARSAALILSDVVGDNLDVIASGPLTPDPTTFFDAWQVIEKYQMAGQIPVSVVKHLRDGMNGTVPETLKPAEYMTNPCQTVLVGSNRLAAEAAVGQAKKAGLSAAVVTTSLVGEARKAGQYLAGQALRIGTNTGSISRPACQVYGGETTVTLTVSGQGGRNQETALAAVGDLDGLRDTVLVTLATDGEDGPTKAAGAVVTGMTRDRATSLGVDWESYLEKHDSNLFFEKLENLVITGPTGTNVNDLNFIFRF